MIIYTAIGSTGEGRFLGRIKIFSLVEVDCEMTENFKKVIEDIYLYGPGPL